MSKKINLATINPESLKVLSEYHVAYKAICEYNRQKRENSKAVKLELEAYKASHKKDEKDYVDKLAEFDRKLAAIDAWYDRVTEPHKKAQKPALALIDKDIYYAYCVAQLKANSSATGKLDISTKSEKKSYIVTKPFSRSIEEFLVKLGAFNTDNSTALKKCADSIRMRCGGMVKDRDGGYLKLKSCTQFRDLVILAFFYFAITERKAIIVKADNTLALNMGENTEA